MLGEASVLIVPVCLRRRRGLGERRLLLRLLLVEERKAGKEPRLCCVCLWAGVLSCACRGCVYVREPNRRWGWPDWSAPHHSALRHHHLVSGPKEPALQVVIDVEAAWNVCVCVCACMAGVCGGRFGPGKYMCSLRFRGSLTMDAVGGVVHPPGADVGEEDALCCMTVCLGSKSACASLPAEVGMGGWGGGRPRLVMTRTEAIDVRLPLGPVQPWEGD